MKSNFEIFRIHIIFSDNNGMSIRKGIMCLLCSHNFPSSHNLKGDQLWQITLIWDNGPDLHFSVHVPPPPPWLFCNWYPILYILQLILMRLFICYSRSYLNLCFRNKCPLCYIDENVKTIEAQNNFYIITPCSNHFQIHWRKEFRFNIFNYKCTKF